MEKCCGNCFGDWFLASEIENSRGEVDDCEFCGSNNVKVVEPQELLDRFELLFGLYEESEDPNATRIESLLREDWGLFGQLDRLKAEALLTHIFNDPTIYSGKFVSSLENDSSAIQEWEDFREELKHQHRYFPTSNSEILGLKRPFQFLEERPYPKVYRARACEQRVPFPLDQMGKPPKNLVGNGRANPVGIPCLYVASDASTAVSEIRPHKGEIVCVAEFEIQGDIRLVDLRDPRKKISPFSLDDEMLKLIHRYMSYLSRLGSELTMPVLPQSAHLDYLPSQYLCEFIKHCGYDGVIYKSAMGSGINYAIFNDSEVAGVSVQLRQIDEIQVGHSAIEPLPL